MRGLAAIGAGLWAGVLLAQPVHVPLNDGWRFQRMDEGTWHPAEVPGVVHTDLLRAGLIPDPYRDLNVDSVQWIEDVDWVYERTITADDTLLAHAHIDLVCKGLDTFAEVHLNDSLLGRADNMFRTWRWPIEKALRPGANRLRIVFRSPVREGEERRAAYGLQLPHDNDPSGVSPYVRKAAYQFGWDFCPRLVTCGIWQPVELRCWEGPHFTDLRVSAVPIGDSLSLFLRTGMPWLGDGMVRFKLDGTDIAHVPIAAVDGEGVGNALRTIALPDRWWPNGAGAQPLHTFTAELLDARGKVLDRAEKRTGFRTIELVQDSDSLGRAFTFRVNGRDFFMKGCNLVPPGMFLPQAGDSAWIALVRDMRRAHMNMVRVWAGGVYPPDAFFDACDTAGILVWQDLMLANLPPGDAAFVENITAEASEQVDRLASHPSLALLCGDNELDVAWRNWGWQERYHLHGADSARVAHDHAALQARLRRIARTAGIAFTPTSPLSNWGSAEGLRSGDLHYWGVWHGDSTFASFAGNVGRFVSEYGFQSYPDSSTLVRYIDPGRLYLAARRCSAANAATGRTGRSWRRSSGSWARSPPRWALSSRAASRCRRWPTRWRYGRMRPPGRAAWARSSGS